VREIESSNSEKKLAQNMVCGPHRLIADEAAVDGGEDLGPSPTEYLSVALAGCTTMTVKMVADRHQWPLQRVQVRVAQQRRPEGRLFMRVLTLEGPLTESQRQQLLDAANRCPVSKALGGANALEIRLA
jgi:putative redox protein